MNMNLDEHPINPYKVAQLTVSEDGYEAQLYVDAELRCSWALEHANLQEILTTAVCIGMQIGEKKLAREIRDKLCII